MTNYVVITRLIADDGRALAGKGMIPVASREMAVDVLNALVHLHAMSPVRMRCEICVVEWTMNGKLVIPVDTILELASELRGKA